jgi:tagatose-6-phosphate ketose/aldose isomerase
MASLVQGYEFSKDYKKGEVLKMFTLDKEKLVSLGASITTEEIKQQPVLWDETYSLYRKKHVEIQAFLQKLAEQHERIRVIFTGAGTSAYVGDTVTPYLKAKVDEKKWELLSVPTTNLVSNPYEFLKADFPTLLVSFARSGNSPESVAAVELAEQIVTNFYQLTITCANDGELAKRAKGDEHNLLLLMPEKANDQGFAMTGSYSCMTLTTLLIFDPLPLEEKGSIVQTIRQMGESVIRREEDIQKIIDRDFDRIIYLGSGSLEGLARESQLKVLELTAGKIVTAFDSPLGFRHGPKSFVNEKTLVFVFVSNHPYTRQYDLDMLSELQRDNIANYICAIEVDGKSRFIGNTFLFGRDAQSVPDVYLALPFVMVGQTVSLLASVKVGNTPDTPSPTGTVNRVVKGVTLYEYK